MQHIAPALGVLAGLAGLLGTAPYVRDVIARSTRPQRGTWLIWSLLAIVVGLSQRADGATWSVVMAALLILGRRAAYSVPGGGATSACSRSR